MSCVAPNGTWLGHAPTAQVLAKFENLPKSERQAGAVKVPEMKSAEQLIPAPPEGGLVLRVHARFLARDEKNNLRRIKGEDFPQIRNKEASIRSHQFLFEPNTEYMWLTKEDWKSLVPPRGVPDEKVQVPTHIVERMVRFHLSPRRALTSEDGIVPKKDVKSARATVIVESASPARLKLRMIGFIHHGTAYDEAKATSPNGPLGFGYDSAIDGVLEYDRQKEVFVRFDMVAPGEVWGRWGDANGKSQTIERPGRSPIGFAFELAKGESPTDRLPPAGHGGRALRAGYFTSAK